MTEKELNGANTLLEEEREIDEKYLTFALASEEYGIDIRNVMEIIGIQTITDLPEMPDFIKGVINLRGKIIPVMDVRIKFKLEEREYDDRTCIVVVHIDGKDIGLIVDSVSDVIDLPASLIEPAPQIKKGEAHRYINGLGKTENRVTIILDVQKLLFEEELEKIAQAV